MRPVGGISVWSMLARQLSQYVQDLRSLGRSPPKFTGNYRPIPVNRVAHGYRSPGEPSGTLRRARESESTACESRVGNGT